MERINSQRAVQPEDTDRTYEQLVSVIIPLYNKEHTIRRALDSVKRQSHAAWEVVVVDDGSTDGGPDLVAREQDERVRLFRKANGGVSSARNYGVAQARGMYILFLDADDYLLPVCLSELLRLVRDFNVPVAAANFTLDDGHGERVFSVYPKRGKVTDSVRALYLMDVALRSGSYLLRADVARACLFDEKLWRYEDYEQQIRMFRRYEIAYSPVPVMGYKLETRGLSMRTDGFDTDYIAHIPAHADRFWERMLYGYLLDEGMRFYPDRSGLLARKYAGYVGYIRYGRWLSPLFRWRHSLLKRLYRWRWGRL